MPNPKVARRAIPPFSSPARRRPFPFITYVRTNVPGGLEFCGCVGPNCRGRYLTLGSPEARVDGTLEATTRIQSEWVKHRAFFGFAN
ncbi:hypothetical protein PoB_006752600 [Plakobranchus ocellatus]|uniref:Post-SET domain-containing protein n=1 Tax=Plakobranchus ocellatus TaxID=259542 RepID=A0AAV4DA23_9GAST|nr:hypothetical protein PoB_006752600 [Plakobranchus ocellatus]